MTESQERITGNSEFVAGLQNRHRQLAASIDQLSGMQQELLQQKLVCITDMEKSRSYLDQKDQVRAVLMALHERSVESVKVLYEDLLTGLLHDIFPDDPENDRVQLNLQVKRNQSSLSIDVLNKEGIARDVFLDKGGSVKSILAIGLRFIALARSPRRRIVVLDEADRALNARDVPRFARMMSQLSSRIGMQVIYISHKDHKLFEGYARIIRLSREDQKVYADCISDAASQEIVGWEGEKDIGDWMEGIGLTDLRLVNVKQHGNTLIELSPLVNVIIGNIDVGKSTIVQAIEAVARNTPREKMIRDHEREMRVEIGLEAGQRLVFSYRRTGSRKTTYRLYDNQNILVQESRDGNSTPDWLHTYLGMELFRGFDVHIGMQGSVDFLLDPRYSDFKRAEILSLSKFSGGSQRMISLHQKKVDQNQKRYTELKKGLSQVKHRLASVQLAGEARDTVTQCQGMFEEIARLDKEIGEINREIDEFQECRRSLAALTRIGDVQLPENDIQELIRERDIGNLVREIDELERLNKEADALSGVLQVRLDPLPVFDDSLNDIFAAGREWSTLITEEKALAKIEQVSLEAVPDVSLISEADAIQASLLEIETLTKEQKALKKDSELSQKKLTDITQELEKEIQAMGPVCVTCQQPINQIEGAHNHD